MAKTLIHEMMFPEIVRVYNERGKSEAYRLIREKFGVKQPIHVIRRIKRTAGFTYDEARDQFRVDQVGRAGLYPGERLPETGDVAAQGTDQAAWQRSEEAPDQVGAADAGSAVTGSAVATEATESETEVSGENSVAGVEPAAGVKPAAGVEPAAGAELIRGMDPARALLQKVLEGCQAEDSAPAGKALQDLLADRMLTLLGYVSVSESARLITIDQSRMIADGYHIMIR